MTRTIKKCTGVFLGLSMALSMAVSAIPPASAAETASVQLQFSGTSDYYGSRDILDDYVCADGDTVRLINGRTIYKYSFSADTYTVEHTFPEQELYRAGVGQSGALHGVPDVKFAYINHNTGKLYYAQDKYYAFSKPEGLAVQVYIYDLEKGKVISSFEVDGESVAGVGSDNTGNVFLSVRQQFSDVATATGLRVYYASGRLRASVNTSNAVDSFAGFLQDGTFYVSEVEREDLENDTYAVKRYLRKGKFTGSNISVSTEPITRLNFNYNRPVSLAYGMLSLYDGEVYQTPGDTLYYHYDIGADVNNAYCAAHNGVNLYDDGDRTYVLSDSKNIMCFDNGSFMLSSRYQADENIFHFLPCETGLLLLLNTGSSFRYQFVAFSDFTQQQPVTINLNDLPVYQRTQADIVTMLAQSMPQDYTEPFFETTGSAAAPYREYTLTGKTRENIVTAANYFRWLEGLTPFQAASGDAWTNAAVGAVLTQRNVELTGKLSHTPDRPDDMDEAFYNIGKQNVAVSNIAYGYGASQYAIPNLLRGFIEDKGYRQIPGHRDTFFTRNGTSFAAGYSPLGAVNTVLYTGSPNPEGASPVGNNQPAYAWPAPGLFPVEEAAVDSLWTVNINYDYARFANSSPVVTISDLTTGEEFVRDSHSTGVHITGSWGKYIAFLPPETDSFEGKSYRVSVSNLVDPEGAPLTLEYTVDFFSYKDDVEIDGVVYTCDEFGNLAPVPPAFIPGDVNDDGEVTIMDVTELQLAVAEVYTLDERAFLAADVNRDGIVNVEDATVIQRYLAEFIDSL